MVSDRVDSSREGVRTVAAWHVYVPLLQHGGPPVV